MAPRNRDFENVTRRLPDVTNALVRHIEGPAPYYPAINATSWYLFSSREIHYYQVHVMQCRAFPRLSLVWKHQIYGHLGLQQAGRTPCT